MKAISLFSGGLDSVLATKLILEQGIDVIALYYKTVFWGKGDYDQSVAILKKRAESLGAKFDIVEISDRYFDIVKNPKHGYGKNINPCIDCKILMLTLAKEYMEKHKASFLVTGEVLGERPMSQNRSMLNKTEKDSGTRGILLSPLTAKLLKPTVPEEEHWIDRDKLYNISGRSRKPQLALAKKYNIEDFPNPAGGCLLTDKNFAEKMRDLIEEKKNFSVNDIEILKNGRVFRISKTAKLIVGRDEKQNGILENLARNEDYQFYTKDIAGPIAVGKGNFSKNDIEVACSVVARYSDLGDLKSADIYYFNLLKESEKIIHAKVASHGILSRIRI